MITGTYHKPSPEITVGAHEITIVDASEMLAATGTPQLHVVGQTKTGAIGHAYLALTEKAEFGICQLLDAVGMAPAEGAKFELNPADLIDKKCWATVIQQVNGRKRIHRFHATRPTGNGAIAQAVADDEAAT